MEVVAGENFQVGEREIIYSVPNLRLWRGSHTYAVAPDDESFLMIRVRGGTSTSELIVVQNFFEELKRLVPN